MTTSTIDEARPVSGPPNSVTDEETGARVYVHPRTGERFDSVTTINGITAKDGLPYWAALRVQEEAYRDLPRIVASTRRKACDQKGDDRCGLCRDCVALDLRRAPDRERDEAADRGRRIHKVADHYALHGELRGHDADIEPYVKQWLRWRDQHEVTFEASEFTVINRAHRYAGTVDGVIRCGWMPPKWRHLVGQPLIEDYKSGKGVYDEHGRQLAAYRHAEAILLPDGTEVELPEMHDVYGALVHIRPDDWWMRPARVCDQAFSRFLNVLHVFRDQADDFTPIERAMYKPRDVSADQPDPEQRCPNCRALLADCDTSGCGQRRRPGWRSDPATPEPPTKNNGRPRRTVAQRVLGADPMALATSRPAELTDDKIPF